MSKIICDICGTVYQDTAESCPICGFTRNISSEEDLLADSPLSERGKGGRYTSASPKKGKEIFNFDEVNPDEEEPEQYMDEDEEIYEEPPRSNTALIIVLVVIITLLLVTIGYLFFRFYVPHASSQAPETQPTVVTEETVPVEEETTEPTIPCQNLILTSGVAELNQEGQYWLLHVMVTPENTTDPLIFTSGDESVVTVTEHGRLTAVGEGETQVTITCGEMEIKCKVVVKFEDRAEDESLGETVPQSVDHEMIPNDAALETTAETEPPTTEAPVVLKLKHSDRSSNKRGVSFTLELDCDLKPEDITWLTLDSNVAIVKDGVVTTIGPGKTTIVAQYGDQQAECIIRCNFN